MSALLVALLRDEANNGRMSDDDRSRWAMAHPLLSVEPSGPGQFGHGAYSPLVYLMSLPTPNSIEGYLRCTECGSTAVIAHRLLRIRRNDDYGARQIDVVDTLFVLDDVSHLPPDLVPSREIRGDSFALELECEDRHRWFLEIGNHKGTVIAALSPGALAAPRPIDDD